MTRPIQQWSRSWEGVSSTFFELKWISRPRRASPGLLLLPNVFLSRPALIWNGKNCTRFLGGFFFLTHILYDNIAFIKKCFAISNRSCLVLNHYTITSLPFQFASWPRTIISIRYDLDGVQGDKKGKKGHGRRSLMTVQDRAEGGVDVGSLVDLLLLAGWSVEDLVDPPTFVSHSSGF